MQTATTPPAARGRRTGRLALIGGATAATAVAAASIIGAMPTAHADTTYNPLEKALGFNAFVENETTLVSTEAEGPIATGGDLLIEGSYNVMIHDVGSYTAPGDTAPSALVVGGKIDYTVDPATSVVQVLNGGYVKVGDLTGTDVRNADDNNASVNTHLVASGENYNSTPRIELTAQQSAESVGADPAIDFADAFATFRSEAAELFACEAAMVQMQDSQGAPVAKGAVEDGQQIKITLEEGRTNILNVTGDDLNNMEDLVFVNQPTADTPLLINVDTSGTGGEFDWDVASQAGISGPQAPYILWNFNGTTRLNIASGDTVEGSILAPDADYSDISAANVEGQIIAKNAGLGVNGEYGGNGGEIHHFPFATTLTCEDDEPSPSPTTDMPTTDGPTTDGPTTDGPTTDGPTTDSPTTDGPTTDEPTTDAPTTDGPTTDGPTTDGPTTDSPTTDAPTTDSLSDEPSDGGGTDGPDSGSPLATTGTSLRIFLIAAGALLVLGAVAVVATLRRKDTSA